MSFFDTGSIWESGLLFSQSKISTILEGNSTPSLEELLLEDDFIQETQSQSHLLMNFLQSGQTMHRLLYYLTVPQLVENEERAYRFPYMSCEALCCNVQPLTDAITSRTAIGKDHLSMLFGGLCNYPGKDGMSKLQAKARRRYRVLLTNPTEQAFLEKFEEKIENGSSNVNVNVNFRPLKPYLAGYVVKVITMLCKRSPAAIVRFLDSTPHILKGLVQHLENSSVTLLLPILFNLPFDRSVPSLIENDDDDDVQGNGMRRLCLSRFDNPNIENIPTLLLGTISDALDLGFRYAESVTMRRSNLTLSSVPHTSATACANAADVIVSLVKTAASSTPHKKFSQEGYNSEHRFGTDVNKGGGIQGVVSSDDKMTSYDDDDDDDDPSLPGPLSLVNAELDMAYHTPLSNDSPDSISLRFLKSLRDGRHATSVQKIAFRSARLLTLLQASSAKGRLGLASGAVDEALGPIQIICESAFRVLSVILDACAKSCMQQQVFKNTSISTPPRILTLLCTNVEELIQGQVQDSTTVSSSSSSSSMSSSTSTISELVKFLNILSSCALDASVVASNKSSRSGPVPPSYENAPKLGSAGLALARALGNFVRCGSWLEVNTTIAKCLIFPCLLDTVQAFPWHSLLHRSVTDAIIDSLRHSSRNFKTNYTGTIVSNHQQQLSAAISSLFFEGKLLTRIVSILKQCRLPTTLSPIFRSSLVSCIPTSLSSVRFNDITSTTPSSESTTPISPPPLSRSTASSGFSTSAELGAAKEFVGFVGHFLLIANTIVSLHADAAADGILNTLSSNIVEKHSDFWALVHHELAVANVTRGVLNGGLAPDTKASGHVGANADATGSRPSTSSSTNTMSLTGENTSDEEVDDEDALMHKINRPHGDEDDDENNNNEEENEEEELERERERNERVRSIERARQIVQLAMSDDDDNDDEEERNTNEGSRKQQEDDFDFDIPQSQSSINTVWNVESQGNDFSAFSAFNDEGDEEETTSTGTGKDTSEDWTFSFATSSPAAAAPISATLLSESESESAGTLSTSPKGLMSISSPTMSFSNEIEQVVASTTNSPKTLTDMSSQKVVTSTFLEEDVFGQLDDEFFTTPSILPTNTTVSISTTSVASEKATTATTSIDDDVFGGGGQIEDDPFGGSTSSFSSITSSIQTTTGGNNVVDDPFAF